MIADEDLAVDLKVQQLLWNMILRIAQAYALKPQTHSQTSPKADFLAYTYVYMCRTFIFSGCIVLETWAYSLGNQFAILQVVMDNESRHVWFQDSVMTQG